MQQKNVGLLEICGWLERDWGVGNVDERVRRGMDVDDLSFMFVYLLCWGMCAA